MNNSCTSIKKIIPYTKRKDRLFYVKIEVVDLISAEHRIFET